MRIKLGLLDSSVDYLRKMSDSLMKSYSNELSVFQFTKLESAVKGTNDNGIDVLVVSPEFKDETFDVRASCVIAYFSDSPGVREINGKPAVCKYQKYDDLYRRILGIYDEYGPRHPVGPGEGKGRIVIFSSPCGGAGTSCMAAAFAIRTASKGKNVLYINLERFGDSGVFFKADGNSGISDIIYAVKLGKSNLRLKFESVKRVDSSGVSFFPSSEKALDTAELTEEESARLISELRASGIADIIVIDMDFSMNEGTLGIFNDANALVWVSDGTETSASKVYRTLDALKIIEQQKGMSILGRIFIMHNKFSDKTGKRILDNAVTILGVSPRIEHAPVKSVIKVLTERHESVEMFDKLLDNMEG